MRRLFLLTGLLAVLVGMSAAPEAPQEPPGKRLSAIVGVAVEEYAKGVDAGGRLVSALELEEAVAFLREAQSVAQRLDSPNAAAVRLVLDSLAAAVARRATSRDVSLLYQKFVVALGAEGALDLPSGPVDVASGRMIYLQRCAGCHGADGRGGGPQAAGLNPPPPAIGTREVMRDVSPSLMFRIISVGVQGTAMTPWSRVLSPDERWAVVGYLNSLRATDGDRAYGDSLLVRYCERCGSTAVPQARRFAWQVERSDAQIAAALASDDSATGVRGAGGLAAADLDRMVAALRATTVVEATVAQARAAREDRSDPRAAARRVTRLVDDALAAARAGRAADAGDLAFDAYIAFEPLETNARMRRPGLVADLERSFAEFKGALKAGDLAAAEAQRNRIEAGLPAILELSTPTSTLWGAFLQSFVIIVREGFEAILVIGAMAAFLMKTGNRRRLRDVWAGSAVGLVLSGVLAVLLRTALAAAPASREIIEGATLLVAVAVLFSVSYWLLSKVEAARWQKFIRDKVNSALSHGGGFALAFVAFLAVFREGAETALFYQALFAAGERVVAPVTAGLVAGSAALALIFALFYRFGVRIPLRPFFAVTSGLLYYMALVFAGKGIRELQEGNAVPQTLIPGFPHVDLVGLYPTVETLAAQGVLLGLLLFALWRALRPLAPEAVPADEPADIPAEVAGRLAELQVTARRLQERVATLEQEVERHRD